MKTDCVDVVDILNNEDRVDILDETTRHVVARCAGPTRTGRCPQADRQGVVACAGRRITPKDAGPAYWLLRVPPGSHHCPLAWTLEASY